MNGKLAAWRDPARRAAGGRSQARAHWKEPQTTPCVIENARGNKCDLGKNLMALS